MIINEQTKIAALLKFNPQALETIVALSPDFKKLRNPILRRIMAPRTSIAMASKIGGCTPQDFFNALAPLGFKATALAQEVAKPDTAEPFPAYLQALAPEKIIRFDVRSLLAGGEDPLRQIQQKVKALQLGEALLIINSFEPLPLISLLKRQGFNAYVHHVDAQTIETYFYKNSASVSDTHTDAPMASPEEGGDWEMLLRKFDGHLVHIDVRHLEMPQPMMTILEALEQLPADKALYVHHKRIPVFLLTELKERNFDYRIKEVQTGEVYLLIFKNE